MKPSEPEDEPAAGAVTAMRAAGARPGHGRGRISADSFKLLTAKLKGAAAPATEAPTATRLPHLVVEEPPVPVLAEAETLREPAWITADAASMTLPDFYPIDFFRPTRQEAEPAQDPPAEAAAASETEIDAPASFPELPVFVGLADEPSEETPGIEAEMILAGEPAAPELQPIELATEPEPVPEPQAEFVVEPEPEPEPVPEPQAEFVIEPEPEPEPQPEPESQPEPPAEPEAELSAAPPPAVEEPESKPHTPASAMAERVVDAMLKTISGAIYAKPTASERAAFLREVKDLMGQDGVEQAAVEDSPPPAPMPVDEPAAELAGDAPLAEVLASRMGPSTPLLRSQPDADDPFTLPAKLKLLSDSKPAETVDADQDSGELALTLLDMMSAGSGSALPHERTLAADTLLRILPRIPVKQLLAVVERVAIMETPPALLVAKLIRDSRAEVVSPLLERCSHISDQDLMGAAPVTDTAKLRMIARRRILSTVLGDYLIGIGEPSVLLTLIRNPGAAFSHDAFFRLAEHASQHHALLAPLATRADLPPPVAFELFWHVPQELRRFIFSRFLTDSETLNKILRITLATHGAEGDAAPGEPKFPPKELIDAAIERAAAFKLDEAATQLAEIGGIAIETALRILSDREGEPLAVLLKGLGYPRSRLEDVLSRLRHPDAGLMRADRNPEELQAIFDGLSFNKARILLTYWDWFVRKAGPYAPHN